MNLAPLPIQKFWDNNGNPLVGGKLFTYVSGTSTKIASYKDAAGTLNTNPIVLDFRGECRLWIDPTLSYTFVLAPANDTDPPGNPFWTVDDITAGPAQQDNAADDTGSVNNIQLSIPQISSPIAFTRIVFKAANTNSGPMTISINGGTAKDLMWQSGVEFSGYEVLAGGIYQAVFDGSVWQLQGPTLSPCDLRSFGGIPDGTTDSSAALAAASTASASGKGNIVIQGGYKISSNVTIARGATIEFRQGGSINVDSGDTLTIAGNVIAGRTQIFFGSGTSTFSFGGTASYSYPEWWGAIPDNNGTLDCTSGLEKAIAGSPGVPIELAAAVYSTGALTLNSASSIRGVGVDESILKSRTAAVLLTLSNPTAIVNAQLTLKDFTLDGNTTGTIGFQVNNYARFSIRDLKFTSFTSKGIYSHGSILWQAIRCEVKNTPIGYDFDSDQSYPNHIAIRDGSINGCVTHAIRADQCALLMVDGADIEACGTAGVGSTMAIYIKNADPDGLGVACVLKDLWMEANSGLAAIVIDKPTASLSKHIVQNTHIFGGTRTSGIHAGGGGAAFTGVQFENVVAQNAVTQDILIGTHVVGQIIGCRFTTESISGTSVSLDILSDSVTGGYKLGTNWALSSTGVMALTALPASASYANDAAAAAGGVSIGQVYRNGSVMQVRVT